MRQSQKQNRSKNRNNRKPSSGFSPNRVYESSGPEGKVRGTPQQIIEKYQSLARDKQTSGDRVMAESFLQHAEHYMRILTAAQAAGQARREEREESSADDGDNSVETTSDPLAVIGDDGEGEIVATPESLNGGGRGRRRAASDDGEADGENRRPRRGRRRERAKDEPGSADAAASGGDAAVEAAPDAGAEIPADAEGARMSATG